MKMAKTEPMAMSPAQLLVALAIAGAIVMSGVVLTWQTASRVLHDDAREQALHWVQYIENNLEDLDGILAGDEIGGEDRHILTLAGDAGNIFRYHIFDPDGRIMFSSDFLSEQEDFANRVGQERQQLAGALLDGEILIELEDGREKPNRPDYYAEAYAPLLEGERVRGVIEVYVDQSAKVARYWDTIGILLIGFAVLLALAAVLPGAFIRKQYERLRSAEAHIFELAFRDTLTGLPNRRKFSDELARTVGRAAKEGQNGALLMFDLDHFKAVNDTLGHHAGDDLLRVVASRVAGLLTDGDIFARLGGDEFAIICRGQGDPIAIDSLARNIVDAIAQPIRLQDGCAHVGASIGIAMIPEHGNEPAIVLKNADIALYRAKDQGRGRHCYFDNTMHEQVQARLHNETELRTAIAENQLELYFQPSFDVQSRRVRATEALLRWHHPDKGLLSADAFLPMLPDSDLLVSLSNLALRKACAAIAELRRHGHGEIVVAVNLSSAQMQDPSFVEHMGKMVADYGIQPANFLLEISESALSSRNADRIGQILGKLHQQGFKLALDDFGAGNASLNHLTRLPIDQVKIDPSLIDGLGHSPVDAALVKSIVTLARELGIEAVAENVQTPEQLELLRQFDCPIAQGYGLASPMPMTDFRELLGRAKARTTTALAE